MMNKHIGKTVFNSEQIKAGVSRVAAQLNEKFADDDVVIITVVPGGILFGSSRKRGER